MAEVSYTAIVHVNEALIAKLKGGGYLIEPAWSEIANHPKTDEEVLLADPYCVYSGYWDMERLAFYAEMDRGVPRAKPAFPTHSDRCLTR